jgi:hypothetical protein
MLTLEEIKKFKDYNLIYEKVKRVMPNAKPETIETKIVIMINYFNEVKSEL